ncbi:MAG: DUF192 domain-containing protein, partial [Patescibacteria group bacterium]
LGVIAAVLACFVVLFVQQKLFTRPPSESYHSAQIGQAAINVEIAQNSTEQAKGLSGRLDLAANQGMLFTYPDYQVRYFWMLGMNFPIDIIWLKDNQIVGFAQAVPAPVLAGDLPQVDSKVPVNAVLETKAGFVNQNQLQIGDQFRLLAD